MSGASKGRKSKNVRPGSKKNSSQNQSPPYEGAYGNARLVHVLLSLVGKKCQAKVKNGGSYEGVFHTFNPKMDVALNVVHKCDKMLNHNPTTNGIDSNEGNDCPKEEELIEEMLFPSESLVSASFEDVDMTFATLEVNETNGESSSLQRSNFKSGEKKLEPWNGGGDTDPLTIGGLEGGLGSDGTNGWGADEMFRANEEKYGVKSDYDSSLSNYTMQLDMKETNEDSIARATRLAQEIESGSDYKRRIDLELDDGRTEEDKFSAVRDSRKDRGSREMRDRDRRDMRDIGEGGYHDKDRGDRERDRDRDHLTSPQGYRKHDYERSHIPGRNRGRGRDSWDKRNQQGFTGSNMGPHRSMGGPGGQSGGGGRNQPPMSPMDGPPGQGGSQGKYRGSSSGQTHLPPRFTKTGSGGHSREEERMRQNDNNAMHSPYQPPKGQRQPRMQRSNMGRQPAWGGPTSPPADYPHHSPTQMHQDPAVISSGPSSGVGGPPLSRSSSNSSNTSTPVQNHRKHLSTSSQEEQPTPQHPPTQQHHQHLRQISSSSSPTGGPLVNNQQQSARPPPQGMPPTAIPGTVLSPTILKQKVISADFCPKILKRQVKPNKDGVESPEKVLKRPTELSSPKQHVKKTVKNIVNESSTRVEKTGGVSMTNNVQSLEPVISKNVIRAKRDLKFNEMSPSKSSREIVHEQSALLESNLVEPIDNTQEEYLNHRESLHRPVFYTTNPKQLQRVRLTIGNQCMRHQPIYHHQHHTPGLQYIIIHNQTGVLHDGTPILPVIGHHVQESNGGVPGHSWASIASRNPAKQQMGHGMSEMGLSHMGQGSSSGIPQQSPRSRMPGIVSVRSNATYTYTPRGGTPPTSSMPTPYPPSGTQSMNQQMPNMGSPRVHPNTQQMHPMGADHMPGPGQMIPRGPPPQQMVPSPPQQQAIQQMPTMQGQHGPRPSQPQAMKTSISPENAQKHSEKAEMMKKPAEQPQTQPTGGKISQLKDFAEKFKLPTDVKKESTNQSSVATTQSVNKVPQQQQQQQRPPPNMGQPPPQTMNRPQPYPNPAHQQQHPYPSPQQQHPQQSYVGPMGPQDHGAAMQHGMPQNAGPVPGNVMLQQPKHQTHPGVVNQMHSHPQQMSHVQIPVAAPSIQQFSAPVPSPQHPAMQPMSRPMDSPKMMPNRMMQPVDKNIPPVQQKPLTSAKVEVSNFQHNANIHVVTGPPVSQANPSAVITVSAANSSPIVSSHYQVPAIPTTQIAQPQRQSPTAAQVGQPSSSPTIEPSTTPVPSSQHSANTSITSPTAGIKALNPEAQEFKPRTPAKPSPIATRATTPQAQMPIYAFVQAPVASGMGPQTPTQIATPVYNAAPMPPMHADMQQIYHTQFPQQYIPVQMPGQQFAFDQNGQPVYASPAPQQAMMAQNARMAATIPGTPQQHIQQYQSDQGPAPVYVPVAPQGSNFMQQRPHSAHTPTQVTHVTASSPATQSTQQTQQPTGHPAMVPAHGVQQGGGPVWMPINANSNIMMVPSGQPQPMQMNQPPQHTHYLSAMPAGQIPSSVAMSNPVQQKGQQQQIPAGHYMAQTPQRSYGQYQSPSANNQ